MAFKSIKESFKKYQPKARNKYVNHEFQDFGLRLANELNDLPHKTLFLKMAKTIDRKILNQALSFVKDAPAKYNKAKLFMWKVKKIREEWKEKETQPTLL
jgi:hypothetical protein